MLDCWSSNVYKKVQIQTPGLQQAGKTPDAIIIVLEY